MKVDSRFSFSFFPINILKESSILPLTEQALKYSREWWGTVGYVKGGLALVAMFD